MNAFGVDPHSWFQTCVRCKERNGVRFDPATGINYLIECRCKMAEDGTQLPESPILAPAATPIPAAPTPSRTKLADKRPPGKRKANDSKEPSESFEEVKSSEQPQAKKKQVGRFAQLIYLSCANRSQRTSSGKGKSARNKDSEQV